MRVDDESGLAGLVALVLCGLLATTLASGSLLHWPFGLAGIAGGLWIAHQIGK